MSATIQIERLWKKKTDDLVHLSRTHRALDFTVTIKRTISCELKPLL